MRPFTHSPVRCLRCRPSPVHLRRERGRSRPSRMPLPLRNLAERINEMLEFVPNERKCHRDTAGEITCLACERIMQPPARPSRWRVAAPAQAVLSVTSTRSSLNINR